MDPVRLAETQSRYGMPRDPFAQMSGPSTESGRVLQGPMQEVLDNRMSEIETILEKFGRQVFKEIGVELDLKVTSISRSENGSWILTVEANSSNGKRNAETFQLSWSGDKAPAHFDLLEYDQQAWPPRDYVFLYKGITSTDDIAMNLSIYAHGRQYPGTIMGRG
ncbi:MAG: hypothetical protein KDD62_00810 [Bdellovibrionales bacterium]|nr:hypothetical protein [Bdellovibrionales bacterium]